MKQYQHLQLSYDNLLCSCDGGASDRKGKTKAQKGFFPAHCDSEKNNRVIKISPLDENCESFFSYDEEGHIYGRTKEAQKAIDVLGLDCSTLVHLRKAAINAYVDCLLSSDEEWDKEILFVMSKDKSGFFARSVPSPSGVLGEIGSELSGSALFLSISLAHISLRCYN